jgi:hypothetical protein
MNFDSIVLKGEETGIIFSYRGQVWGKCLLLCIDGQYIYASALYGKIRRQKIWTLAFKLGGKA